MDEAGEGDNGCCDDVVAAASGIRLAGLVKMTSNGVSGSREVFADEVGCEMGPCGKVTCSDSFDPSARDR